MSRVNNVHEIRDYNDAVAWAIKRGGHIVEGGSHSKVKSPTGGIVPLPRHKGDFAKGTRFSIIKRFILVGLGIFSVTAVAVVVF